jgi:predicted PurR-regulated permease PerM
MVIVTFLAIVLIATLSLLIFGTILFFRGSSGNLSTLFQKMADIIEGSLKTLPACGSWNTFRPMRGCEGLKTAIATWLRQHVGELRVVGKEAVRAAEYIIVIVSFSQSVNIVIGSLVFLVVIHKFEYFLNARIVGTQIRSKAWEILLAIMIMEAVFGIPGVIAAPIYYAYVKDELMTRELI